jgi:hypothetical protein
VQVGEVAIPLLQVEAVPDEELVRHGEAHVAHGEILDEPTVRTIEQGHGRE